MKKWLKGSLAEGRKKEKMMLRKIWKYLPLSYRLKLRPVVENTWSLFCSIFAIQNLEYPVGRVSIPYFAKHFLKRSVAQQGEDLILDRILTQQLKYDLKEPGHYVDIGAYHPIDHSVTYLLYRRGWRGIVFDPSSATRDTFNKWRRGDQFVQAVVGDVDGIEVDFYIAGETTDMSLHNTKYPKEKKNYKVKKFRQVNINKELERRSFPKIDVLNIDVEGAEFEILNTLDFNKYSPVIIALEIHGVDVSQALKSEEARLVLSKGYRLVGCAVITYFFVKESLISD